MSHLWIAAFLFLPLLAAQEASEKSKAETLIIKKPARTIEFDTDEATWMSVDVSPGGGVEQVRAKVATWLWVRMASSRGSGRIGSYGLLGMGGMKPHDALRVTPLGGARALGLDRQVGSIEAGELADLIVLDRNPLENPRNSESIRYVIKLGDVYEGEALNQVWPARKKLTAAYWSEDK